MNTFDNINWDDFNDITQMFNVDMIEPITNDDTCVDAIQTVRPDCSLAFELFVPRLTDVYLFPDTVLIPLTNPFNNENSISIYPNITIYSTNIICKIFFIELFRYYFILAFKYSKNININMLNIKNIFNSMMHHLKIYNNFFDIDSGDADNQYQHFYNIPITSQIFDEITNLNLNSDIGIDINSNKFINIIVIMIAYVKILTIHQNLDEFDYMLQIYDDYCVKYQKIYEMFKLYKYFDYFPFISTNILSYMSAKTINNIRDEQKVQEQFKIFKNNTIKLLYNPNINNYLAQLLYFETFIYDFNNAIQYIRLLSIDIFEENKNSLTLDEILDILRKIYDNMENNMSQYTRCISGYNKYISKKYYYIEPTDDLLSIQNYPIINKNIDWLLANYIRTLCDELYSLKEIIISQKDTQNIIKDRLNIIKNNQNIIFNICSEYLNKREKFFKTQIRIPKYSKVLLDIRNDQQTNESNIIQIKQLLNDYLTSIYDKTFNILQNYISHVILNRKESQIVIYVILKSFIEKEMLYQDFNEISHANSIVIRKNNNDNIQIYRIEPHGQSSIYCRNSVRKRIRDLFIKLPNATYYDHPINMHDGLQSNEDTNKYFPNMSGYCMLWTFYLTCIIIMNPTKSIDDINIYLKYLGIPPTQYVDLIYNITNNITTDNIKSLCNKLDIKYSNIKKNTPINMLYDIILNKFPYQTNINQNKLLPSTMIDSITNDIIKPLITIMDPLENNSLIKLIKQLDILTSEIINEYNIVLHNDFNSIINHQKNDDYILKKNQILVCTYIMMSYITSDKYFILQNCVNTKLSRLFTQFENNYDSFIDLINKPVIINLETKQTDYNKQLDETKQHTEMCLFEENAIINYKISIERNVKNILMSELLLKIMNKFVIFEPSIVINRKPYMENMYGGNNSIYLKKYLKYKQKYLKLKNKLSLH